MAPADLALGFALLFRAAAVGSSNEACAGWADATFLAADDGMCLVDIRGSFECVQRLCYFLHKTIDNEAKS